MPGTVPLWPIRDQGDRCRTGRRSSEEQGKILADVIGLAEAIDQGKGTRRPREPLRMRPFPMRDCR